MRLRTTTSSFLLCLLLVGTPLAAAPSDADVFIEPEKAGIDYELQGEYVGTIDADDSKRIGIQVIALGDGKFRAVGHQGGLPGDGWSRGDKRHAVEAELNNGQVIFKPVDSKTAGFSVAILKDGCIAIVHKNKTLLTLNKVQRKSPTLGALPPEGAIVLFDGSHADAWENGSLTEGDLLGATNVASKRKFGDHLLHIEFRTPFMPGARGQGRGNSGVYIQSRYECQVLDSFGLEGANNECGGIYSIAEPAVNMCFPPLVWQTYDMDFTAAQYDDNGEKTKNARVTIRHNGVVIHDDLELTHGTPGRHPEGAEPDSVFMQDHGNPVVFRNIWVVEK